MTAKPDDRVACECCKGLGKVRQPTTYSVRTRNLIGPFPQPGSGSWIPCPICLGKKEIPVIHLEAKPLFKFLPLLLLVFLFGCASVPQDPFTLVAAHEEHRSFWGSPDMRLVDAIHDRGGISDETYARFQEGEKFPEGLDFTCWGTVPSWYDYEAMGATFEQWQARDVERWGKTSTIHGRRGAITVRSHGNGTHTIR